MDDHAALRRIRLGLLLFMLGLVVSGVTAIPLRYELSLLEGWLGPGTWVGEQWPALAEWIGRVHEALVAMDGRYPFLAYGYDWLAFGHFVIAVAFVGPLRDPERNGWVVDFGLIACALVIPYALVFGHVRGIPLFWRFIDTLFGFGGLAVLGYVRRQMAALGQSSGGDGCRPGAGNRKALPET
ncbi:MAG: hypothetical protein D6791_11090 [Chloroflexi bacterium]|nr:MAG: hypothetical protein D6791_11090 [Chloroflexota bacterium]